MDHRARLNGGAAQGLHSWALAGFARAAGEYERARPGYPSEAIEWLAGRLDLRPGKTVVDLGAGTGKLSRQLAATGASVVAIEPVAEMRAFLAGIDGVRALEGSAEQIPLPDTSVDAVAAAQAFHWFRAEEALPEIHRVLRPSSRLALLWNRLDPADRLSGAVAELVARHRGHPSLEAGAWRPVLEASGLFAPPVLRLFPHHQEVGPEELAERVASESSIAILPEPERREALAEARSLVAGPSTLRYVTEVYLSART